MEELKIYANEETIRRLTDDQKKAIQRDTNILVSASAGCGKTSTMVLRILAEIGRGTPLRKMLILVFNDAAGEELKQKLSEKLYEQIMSDGKDRTEEEMQFFRNAIDDMSNCHIGTTHSFCANMIRQYFDKIDLSPTFGVATEDAKAILMNIAMNEVFDDYFKSGDAVFSDLCDIYASSRGEDGLKKALIKIYDVIDARPNKPAFIEQIKGYYDSDPLTGYFAKTLENEFRNKLVRYEKEIDKLKPQLEKTEIDEKVDYTDLKENFSYIKNKISYFKICSFEDVVNTYDEEFIKKAAKRNTDKDPLRAMAASIIKKFKEEWKAFYNAFNNKDLIIDSFEQNKLYVGKMLEIVESFESKFDSLKKERNLLTFNDLEHKMVELLDVYGNEIKQDYDVLFVDEYQDVNPTQEYIYSHLINGKAYFVGDVKQSIYEFRLADPSIFLKRQEEYQKDDNRLTFKKNFRSNDGILSFVNKVFSAIMTIDTCDIDYKSDAAFVEIEDVIGKSVELHLFKKSPNNPSETKSELYDIRDEGGARYEKLGDMQGKFIAKTIKELVREKKDKEEKKYNYSDIVLLFRKRTGCPKDILNALKKENIPVDCGSFLKGTTGSEKEIIQLLSVIDNPRQDIYLAGYMMSVLGGFSEKDLLEIANLKIKSNNFYDKVVEKAKEDSPLGHDLENMLKKIDELRTKASFKTVSELIRTIISDFAFDAYLMKKGDNETIELNAFINAVECMEENNDLSKFLSIYSENDSKIGETAIVGGNRVKVATYHSFKGLEAPVVFLPGLDEAINRGESDDVVFNNDGLIALDYYDIQNKKKVESTNKTIIKRCNDAAEEKSNMRLLYVALTRAKDKMYLLGGIPRAEDSEFAKVYATKYKSQMIDYIGEYLYEHEKDLSYGKNYFIYDELNFQESIEREVFEEPTFDEGIIKDIGTYKFEYPFEESTKLSAKYSVTGLNATHSEEGLVPNKFERNTTMGTIAHKIMELINFEARSLEDVNNEIERMIKNGDLTKDLVDNLSLNGIVKALNSYVMDIARNSRVLRELKFTMYVPACDVVDNSKSTDKVMVQGVIDLLIEGKDGAYLVDYKLSNLESEELKEKYKKQLYLYKKAYESATSKKITKMYIISLVNGNVIPLD